MPRVVPQPQPPCAERVCPIQATPRHSDTLPLGWPCQTAAEWVVLAKVTPEVSCKKKHECEGSRAEQGQLELAAQDCAPLGFEYLQECRLYNFTGQFVAVLWSPSQRAWRSC